MTGVSKQDDLTKEYSQRLGVLSGAQLQSALDRFGLGELADARPPRAGSLARTCF